MLLGNLLRSSQQNIVAASKIPPLNRVTEYSRQRTTVNVYPAEHVLAYADKIRAMLRVDTIPLLQFHVWDDRWAVRKEFARTVEKLKRDGIIHSFGLSVRRWQPDNGIKALRTGLVDCVQRFTTSSPTRRGRSLPCLRRDGHRSHRAGGSGRGIVGRPDQPTDKIPLLRLAFRIFFA